MSKEDARCTRSWEVMRYSHFNEPKERGISAGVSIKWKRKLRHFSIQGNSLLLILTLDSFIPFEIRYIDRVIRYYEN